MTVLGTLVYFPSINLAAKEGRYAIVWMDTIALFVVYLLLFRKKIPYSIKAYTVLGLNYLLGTGLLMTIGTEGGGLLWLFPFPILAGILFNFKHAVFSLGLNFVSLIIVSTFLMLQPLGWSMPQERFWVVGLNFMITNALVCVSIMILMRGLQENIKRKDEYLRFLKAKNFHIGRSKKNLEKEILQRVEIEKELAENLKDKEVLLQEIHHRVKNNLQIVSGMLNLQNIYASDMDTSEVLGKAQDRIQAMALIHDHLYQQDKFSSINMKNYLGALVRQLVSSYSSLDSRVTLYTDIDPLHIPMEKAIPCGLIVNELISNSLKHAFPNGLAGSIKVSLKSGKESSDLLLTIRDDGVGMPYELQGIIHTIRSVPIVKQKQTVKVDRSRPESLGLMIVKSLLAQLKAEIRVKVDNGTEVTMSFPKT
nr:sensor histidine kinase [Leptospira perolatii]